MRHYLVGLVDCRGGVLWATRSVDLTVFNLHSAGSGGQRDPNAAAAEFEVRVRLLSLPSPRRGGRMDDGAACGGEQ